MDDALSQSKDSIIEAACIFPSELDGIAPEIIVRMASEPDVMRHITRGGDRRRHEWLMENT